MIKALAFRMISIKKLMQNIMQCQDSNLVLPSLNEPENNPFIQKTAIDFRRMELEKADEVFTQLNESNFTMDNEIEKINKTLGCASAINSINGNIIPPESLIIYIENETVPLPEIILNLLTEINYSPDEWYIYGVKNPESFYKSFLLLMQLDFIIKNKTEKKNEIATFKREMALHYETYYKSLEYRKLHMPHYDMIHKLTNMDNYCGYDALRFLCDYCKVNIIILDIIEKKYLEVRYIKNTLIADENVIKNHKQTEFIIIIKYTSETYLPLMNSNGKHIFNQEILKPLLQNYERIIVEKYKEPILEKDIGEDIREDIGGDLGEDIEAENVDECKSTNENEAQGDIHELNLSDIEEPADTQEIGNFLENKTISIFFNNTVASCNDKQINKNPIIITENFNIAIEDMIEIDEDTNNPSLIDNKNDNNNNDNSDKNDKNDKNSFNTLLNQIPMTTVNNNPKIIKQTKQTKQRKSPKTNLQNISIGQNEKDLNKDIITNTTDNLTDNIIAKEELKPIKAYNLLDLQILARVHKIDTQKEGKSGKKVNKTKEEIYVEIKEKIQSL